ncbi:C-type lectin domain family 4 member G-like [Coturnix japonica]|uniref:C-type lectin domain family 4 member G-like n=1 Tax=Coturnix japonica TaxID=93934 RepID=UPI000777FCE5|nr:C-type lectin domain family 4 member G-like [Coturnix japonica]
MWGYGAVVTVRRPTGSALDVGLAMLEGNQTELKKRGLEMAALLETLTANQSSMRLEVSGQMVSVWKERSTTRNALNELLHGMWVRNSSWCRVCPIGWRFNGGSCYHVGSGSVGWAQAQGNCRDSGAQLVVIGDAKEQEFLTSLAPQHETWIGLHDRSTEGSFQWVDGSNLSFRNWRWGQPDEAGGGEDCVAMDNRGMWGDRPCAVSLGGWVCERPWGC